MTALFLIPEPNPVLFFIRYSCNLQKIIQAGVTLSILFWAKPISLICAFACISLCVMTDTAQVLVILIRWYFSIGPADS